MQTNKKFEKSYVLYANEQYYSIVRSCVKSLREFSELPILVYLLDSDLKIDLPNVTTIRWDSNTSDTTSPNSTTENYYINRSDFNIYKLLIQRPAIVKHALENYSEVVAYVDSDSVATQYCDRIFDMYDTNTNYPYFVEGIYDYQLINGR